MKKIATIAAIAALTTLAACGEAEVPAEVTATEAAATEATNTDVTATEVGESAGDRVEAVAPVAPAVDSK
jgi:ABC-type glycerol-3-phosphate transport system substrate-binding protein